MSKEENFLIGNDCVFVVKIKSSAHRIASNKKSIKEAGVEEVDTSNTTKHLKP